MVRITDKGIRFEMLIKRADTALENDYCIEASTIYYAIIEERFHSILDTLEVTYNKRNCKMYHGIQRMKNILSTGHYVENPQENSIDNLLDYRISTLMQQEYDINLLINLDIWRVKRNSITHNFAKENMDYNDVRDWAKEGKNLLRNLLSSTMRFNKKKKKMGI
ncbi:hypothetical protein [Psychrobacillus psychrotolerans]|uniref:hypothetical protein n=1 Tax=Psychrobacillus psychrotolerans TaxID=126156 RepID=UPI003315BF93